MTKVKKTAVVLLAILLIAGFALLPQAVSALSDRKENRKAGTAPVQSVDLIIDSIPNSEANAVATPGYMLRKLAMEQNMTSVPILPDAAVMTQAEALAAARENDRERAANMARVLLTQAELVAGMMPEDPAAYSDLVCSLF